MTRFAFAVVLFAGCGSSGDGAMPDALLDATFTFPTIDLSGLPSDDFDLGHAIATDGAACDRSPCAGSRSTRSICSTRRPRCTSARPSG